MRALTVIAAGLLALMFFAGPASATSGGTDKYGGHTPSENSATAKHPAGVYHCHGAGAKRAMCDMRVRVVEQQERLNRMAVEASARAKELAQALEANNALDRELAKLRGRLRTAEAIAGRASREREAATLARDNALRDMREAEARAAGSGPAVSSRCKDGVKAAVDKGRWGWGSDAKEVLRKACLY